jgi:uncharacterized membrane protein YjjB (DUF3815 family)
MIFLFQTIAAMLGTLGLAILFQAPVKQWAWCCAGGGFGWLASSTLVHLGLPIVLSTVVATTVLTLFSRFLSTVRTEPVSVFLLTGIFPLVPGVKIYHAASYAFSKDLALFGDAGMEALMQSGAIVMGILIASSVPQGLYDRLARRLKAARQGRDDRRQRLLAEEPAQSGDALNEAVAPVGTALVAGEPTGVQESAQAGEQVGARVPVPAPAQAGARVPIPVPAQAGEQTQTAGDS